MGSRIEPQAPFGEAVRIVREDRKLTKSRVACRGGISIRWLSDVEAGKCNPTLANIRRLATGLGIGLSELMAEVEHLEGKRRQSKSPQRLEAARRIRAEI